MKLCVLGGVAAAAIVAAAPGCSKNDETGLDAPDRGLDSKQTRDRIQHVRARFAGVIPKGGASSFERTREGLVASAGPNTTAKVRLPSRASEAVSVEDIASGLRVGFAVRDASDVPLSVADGVALYAHA